MRFSGLLLFFIFLITNAFGFTCDTQRPMEDLRGNIGPIRDQDSIGWCYAFTAADLIGDYLNRHREKLPSDLDQTIDLKNPQNMISPLSGAFAMEQGSSGATVSYSYSPDPEFKNYDDILKINLEIKGLNEKQRQLCSGDCRWECIGKNTPSLDCKAWTAGRDLLNIEQNSDKIRTLLQKRDRFSSPYEKGIVQGGRTENIAQFYMLQGFSLESDLPSTDASNADYISGINRRTYDAYTNALTREEAKCNVLAVITDVCRNCKLITSDVMKIIEQGFDHKNSVLDLLARMPGVAHKVKNPESIEVANTPILSPELGRTIINEYLQKGQIVGIGYDVKDVVSLNSGGHASSVVGRKCVDGQEHYILRNSWGQNACEESKKKMTLEYLKRRRDRVKFDPDVTDEIRQSVAKTQDYYTCFNKCESLLVDDFTGVTNESKLKRAECRDQCYENNKSILSKNVETFECDQGYYLIRSERLLKNIEDVQVINNKN